MATHNRIYIAPSHIKKVFANMKRQEKDFSDRRPRKPKRKDTEIPQSSVPIKNVADEVVYEEMDDSLGGGPKRQDTIEDTIAQTRYENVSKFSNDSLLAGVNTPQSDDEASLGDQEVASKQGRKIHDIDANEDITLENVHDADMFGVHDLNGDESTKPNAVTTAATITTTAVTRPNAKGLVIQEQEQASTPITSSKDKGKGIMEERIAREKKESNAALIAQWNDIQDKVDTDYELAQRLQAEEQEELTIEEKSKLFQQLLEKRRKHFAAKRAEERRNRPPTKAQQRSIMCTYLKNMAGWKPKDLKTKSFANVQELFDKAMKRVNTFVDMDTELMEGSETREESSSKRAGDELEQEPSKKQKVDDDKETEELKQCMEIISDDGDDVTIKATPLSTKSPTIVDYKIYKEGKKSYFQIIRADGNSQMYLTFGKMLKNFDREDLEVLWSIVKARFKKTEPVNYMDIFLHLNLKTMFEHHLEDSVWKNQQGLVKVLNWKLYDSCGVHCVTMQNILYYLLVKKIYPLIKHILHQMFNDVKLQVNYKCEMAFELLRLVKKQLKEGYGRIVGIKSLLEVTAITLVLLVQKLLLLVLKVNAAGIKVITAKRLQLLKG
ncbi:hypothetical protein Tco_1151241 [Tanacetum coccineum]